MLVSFAAPIIGMAISAPRPTTTIGISRNGVTPAISTKAIATIMVRNTAPLISRGFPSAALCLTGRFRVPMRLVTFHDRVRPPRVGRLEGERVVELAAPTMLDWLHGE